eukprot:SAG25_NODE_655_length_6126_cov_12.125270_10_plen_174_part_00
MAVTGLRRNCGLENAIPNVLNGLVRSSNPEEKAAVNEYRASTKGGNYSHTGGRVLAEMDGYVMQEIAFQLARRHGFKAEQVCVEPPHPHPFIMHRPEAWPTGVASVERWEDVSAEVRGQADPDGDWEQFSADFKSEVTDKMHDPREVLGPYLPPNSGAMQCSVLKLLPCYCAW